MAFLDGLKRIGSTIKKATKNIFLTKKPSKKPLNIDQATFLKEADKPISALKIQLAFFQEKAVRHAEGDEHKNEVKRVMNLAERKLEPVQRDYRVIKKIAKHMDENRRRRGISINGRQKSALQQTQEFQTFFKEAQHFLKAAKNSKKESIEDEYHRLEDTMKQYRDNVEALIEIDKQLYR